MQNMQQSTAVSSVEDLKLAHELTLLFSGIDIGIAVYSKDLYLLTANDSFYVLHGMSTEDVSIGAHIKDVIHCAVAAKKLAGADIEQTIKRSLSCISANEKYSTNVQNGKGQAVQVCRYKRANGMVVETVQVLEIDAETLRLPTHDTLSHTYDLSIGNLMDAINSMNDGLALFDPSGILVAFNAKYKTLNQAAASAITVGAQFDDIISTIYDSGDINVDGLSREQFIENAQKQRISPTGATSHQNKDGTWVRFSGQRLDSGFTVFTAADVSNLKKQELQSQELANTVKHQKKQIEDAISNMSHALCMFDSNKRPITYNQQYVSLFLSGGDIITDQSTVIEPAPNAPENKGKSPELMERLAAQYRETGFPENTCALLLHLEHGRIIKVRYKTLSNGNYIVTASDVTERERDAKLITEQKEQIDFALANMTQGMCLFDADNHAVFFNDQYADMLGLVREDISEDMTRADIINASIKKNKYDPDVAANLLEKYEKSGFGNEEFVTLNRYHDGRIVEVHNKPLENGHKIVTALDVTRRETDAAKIAQQSSQFKEALANMSQGMCMYDSNNRAIFLNDQYVEQFGMDRSIAKPGVSRLDLIQSAVNASQYTPEVAKTIIEKYQNKGFSAEESTFTHRFSDGRVMEVHNKPLENGNTIVVSTDVTQREKNVAKIERYTRSLERSNSELQDFAYVASHDLQEPLRKIEAFGDRLSKKYAEQIPEDGQMYLDRMQNAANRMRQLINDLLSYSRVASKAQPFISTDLNEVVEGVLSDIQMRIEDTDGKVDVEGLETIDCDPLQMRQLFQNLISNALKFKKEDVKPHIRVSGEIFKENQGTALEQAFHKIQIIDNGIGFEDRFKDQIFAIFKRLHGRLEYEGTGIGLSTCRKIAERHRGSIDASGKPDVGSTFTIILPVKNSNDEDL